MHIYGNYNPLETNEAFWREERYRGKHRNMHMCIYAELCTYVSAYVMGTSYVHVCIA